MIKKAPYVLLFSLLIFFAGLETAAAEEIDKDFHQSFDVKQGDTLDLRFGDGDVKIIPWDKNVIDVSVRYRADIDTVGIRLGRKEEFDVEFRQTSNTVYVTGKEPSYATIGFHNERIYEYVYEIYSPDYIVLDLDGDDGDVNIEDWAAEIECRIDDGDIRLRNISGRKTTIRGEDGDMEIDNLTGELAIELDDGDVSLMACNMGNCRIEGEDGEVTIRQSKGSFDIFVDDGDVVMKEIEAHGLNIAAEDGDIELDLLSGGTLDADIRTDDGDINIDLERGFSVAFHASADDADSIRLDLDDLEDYREDEETKSGSINGGNGRLRIRTADGNVIIKER
jgi:DUF4097 and DUF4098 domain-containing protein YvlB